jgi:hypothetical protein
MKLMTYQGRLLMAILIGASVSLAQPAGGKNDYPIKAVPFDKVKIEDGFWSPRLETNRTVTIPHDFKECEETGRIDNFAIAAGLKEGKFRGLQFNDSDVFKVIEGASYSLAGHPDAELGRYLDGVIAKIAAAQETDGYLYTPRRLIRDDYQPPGGKERWVGIKDGSHELYNAGHLYEAAVAHYLATGKRSLLEVALKNADLLCDTFGPGKRGEVPGHQEIEIGLCKLYRVTGNEKYLKLAKFYLDERGNAQGHELMGDYAQDHKPVRDQEEAVGHAVRAAYMYSGMLDVAALTGDGSYVKSLDRIWDDVVGTKMYITGGIGATGGNEGFSHPYVLPNLSAYCETCAAIANALWNERMFLYHGDAKYLDVLERVIYNGFLSGVSMTGDKFFYPNPLESFRGAERSPWFECACCPPNVARFVPSIAGYVYAQDGSDLYVNLFIGSEASVALKTGTVGIRQETRYPWDGTVRITLDPETTGEFSVKVRIPGWAQDRPVPSDLYRYLDKNDGKVIIRVNGELCTFTQEKGFALLQRVWRKGDVIDIDFPMPIRRVLANDKLRDDRGRVALERGPVVFCAEGMDTKDGNVLNLVLRDNVPLRTEFRPDLLNGVQVIHASGIPTQRTLDGRVAPGQEQEFTAIPYHAWAHRGLTQMSVWPARVEASARPSPAPTIAFTSKVSVSGTRRADAVNDQLEPQGSIDHSIPFFHWWPRKGTQEWVQYDFKKPETVSSVEVYWFDDTGVGECRVPVSWRVLYRDGDQWKSVKDAGTYGVEKDRYNKTTFSTVTTDGLRLEIQLNADYSTGLFEWKVE